MRLVCGTLQFGLWVAWGVLSIAQNIDTNQANYLSPTVSEMKIDMQLTSPVQWQKTLQTLLDRGLERSLEIGPNKVIAGIMKRISKDHTIDNVSA